MIEGLRTARAVIRSLRIYYGDRPRAAAMDRLYSRFVRRGDLVFDVGAHVGDRIASFRRLGARVVTAAKGRGVQLRAGAMAARGEWLLFLHADTRLAEGWAARVAGFIANPANLGQAAAFRFRLDNDKPWARRLEALIERRSRWFGLPTGHQGLLISRAFYDSLGGYPDLPSMEDIEMIGRIGGERLRVLPIAAVNPAARYQGEGWWKRMMRDAVCVGLWFVGVPATRVARLRH